MVATAEFIDVIQANFSRSPLVRGTWRAVYVTGSPDIAETAAQFASMKADGVGAIRICQTPNLALFAEGHADVADVEPFAGTDTAARDGVAQRQAAGITEHTLYVSLANLGALEGSIADPAGVGYWVADWSWSLAQAQAELAAHPNWRGVQFGDPASNPRSLVPGTSVDLAIAQCDIDCGRLDWLNQFLPGTPPPPPPPPPAPKWPFGPFDYLGRPSSDPHCHSGYFSTVDNRVVAVWQQRMHDRGWWINGHRLGVDGFFGPDTRAVEIGFAQEKGLNPPNGLVTSKVWDAAWTLPVT